MSNSQQQQNTVEVIPNRLYWICDNAPPRNRPNSYYFCIDNVNYIQELVYEPFCNDFGPLNLGMTHKFCTELDRIVNNDEYSRFSIYHYCSLHPHKRANAAYLIGAFQIIILQKTAEEAWRPFQSLPPFVGFRDASYTQSTFQLPILHCLRGLEKAIKLQWYNFTTFNLSEYEFYERVENGDWNWIIPNKFIAFSSPSPTPIDPHGFRTWTPEDYVSLFRSIGVTTVIRLNKKTYEASRFRNLGVNLIDIYFLDGSCPTEGQIRQFIDVCERTQGAIAVHCKAGLGRTGTMLGCYIMKHYDISAMDFIGWIRIARPGSVLGPQQQFLCEMEAKCKNWGRQNYDQESYDLQMSPQDRRIAQYGDTGQGSRLMQQRMLNQSPQTGNRSNSNQGTQQRTNGAARTNSIGIRNRNVPQQGNIFRQTNGVSYNQD